MGYSAWYLARFYKGVEFEHLTAARLNQSYFLAQRGAAPGGIAGQSPVPLFEAAPYVVKALDGFRQHARKVGQLRLEAAYACAAHVGQSRSVGAIVCHRAVDIHAHGPVLAFIVDVVGQAVRSPYHGQDTAVRVVAGFGRLEAQMRGNSADIIHHGRNIRKYILVFALQDIIGSVTFGNNLESIVYKACTKCFDFTYSAVDSELSCDFFKFIHDSDYGRL